MKEYLRKQIFVSLCVYLGQVLVGYAMGWSAPVIPKLDDPNQSPLPGPITQGQSSWIASLLYIGCIIGPNISSYLSNTKGRKLCFFIAGVLIIFSFILLAAARNLVMIYTGRVTIGLGIGIIAVFNLVYIGEIASTNIRGILLTGTGIFSTLGTLLIYSVGPYVSYASTSYIGLCLSMLYIVGLYFIPETPLFYVMQGQSKAAETALVALGRQDEIDNILNMRVKKDQKSITQLMELVRETSNRNALIITLTLSILQQMSGVVVVVFFATTIFELAGSSIHPNVATIVIGITQLVSSCIAPFVVEKGGRKVLLLFSTTICANSLAILGIYFFMDSYDYPNIEKVAWLPLVTLIIFFLSYDFGFGIIPGTFAGEMFQPQLRSIGSAVTVTTAWLFGFGISTAFGYMISELGGHITFWFYSGACAIATLFTIFYIPETKGKTLEEVQEMLR